MDNYYNNEETARAKEIAENLAEVQERIAQAARVSGRDPKDITLVSVTKTKPASDINIALHCGTQIIGENRVQELLNKLPDIQLSGQDVHLIGHLQTNKVRQIIDKVQMIQSVDSVHLASEIEKQAKKNNLVMNILVEVNIGGEEAKSGVEPDKLPELLEKIAPFSHLCVRGLMTVPPIRTNKEELRPYFSSMRKLFVDNALEKLDNRNMQILSMGMSSDFEVAIEEGATMVRVGTAIFGKR
ncbi:MAG TPA: YggS family pyridoxal phosphate-dependent enzyme [Ruminococcaceae bacterium]|nr:YggS family pyridoxal phosphate-dependent enzyme [Oscillospiraceae bacterium]